ncbi:MAG: flagellar biosynthetic protein FliO [Bacillota bacterium]
MNGNGLSLAWQIIQFLFFFALVIGLVYATTRLVGKRLGAPRGGKFLHIVEGVPLGQKSGLYLVELAGRVLLLGLTEGQMSILTTFDGPEATRLLAEGGEEIPVEEAPVNLFGLRRNPSGKTFAEEMQEKIERLRAIGTRKAGEAGARAGHGAGRDEGGDDGTESDEP